MIAASAGNHALALAYHGHVLQVPVVVVTPVTAPIMKVCSLVENDLFLRSKDCGCSKWFPSARTETHTYTRAHTQISQCLKYGARVELHGNDISEAKQYATELAQKEHLQYING